MALRTRSVLSDFATLLNICVKLLLEILLLYVNTSLQDRILSCSGLSIQLFTSSDVPTGVF